jgi:hypothetical protein
MASPRQASVSEVRLTTGLGEILALLLVLIYVAGIIAAFAVSIAIWRGMRAHERMADSMERMEGDSETIKEIIRRDGEPRA